MLDWNHVLLDQPGKQDSDEVYVVREQYNANYTEVTNHVLLRLNRARQEAGAPPLSPLAKRLSAPSTSWSITPPTTSVTKLPKSHPNSGTNASPSTSVRCSSPARLSWKA